MYKVRFNLGKGERYMKCKVTFPDNTAEYYEPSEVRLILKDCKLRNQKASAKKIFEGGHKEVCAYIQCRDINIVTKGLEVEGERISYNPRVAPNWLNESGEDIDNTKIQEIVTIDRVLIKTR